MTRAQRFSVLTCAATYVLIVIGGIVRITDSGLGCPDWPLCHGQVIPPAEKAVLIEFSHRTAATIVGFLIVGMGILIWRQHRERLIRGLMLAVFPLLATQVILGGLTVRHELPAGIVAIHHATAMLLLSLLILITVLSIMSTRGRPASLRALIDGTNPYVRWPLIAALATLALMATGSYVAATPGASLAFDDWPLFSGSLLPDGGRLQDIHFLHRMTAALIGVIIVAVAEHTRRTQRGKHALVALAGIAVALYGAQVIVGAGNIWTDLSDVVAATHLALGALLWSTLVLLTVLALYEAEPARTRRAAEAGRPELAHEP